METRNKHALLFLTIWTLCAGPALAQWSQDPLLNTVIADRASEQVVQKIASTSDGGCYVAWFDLASGNYDVYLQRFDGAGYAQWPANGRLISGHAQSSSLTDWDLIADAQDQAVLVFCDARAGSDLDIYAYRVDRDGTMLWGPDGITLSANADYEPSPQVTQASDGDFVVVWAQLPNAGDGQIRMQRLAPDGTLRFASGGIPVAGEVGDDPAFADVIPSQDGSVILSWVKDISTYYSNRWIRAQRISATGTPLWATFVEVYNLVAVPLGYFPKVMADGDGGALCAWHASESNYNARLQHLDADGIARFPTNGLLLSTAGSFHHLAPVLVYHHDVVEYSVFWEERNASQTNWGIFGQRVTAAGDRLWGNSGRALIPVTTDYNTSPRALLCADGAMVFTTDEAGVGPGNDRIIGMRVDAQGDMVWSNPPLAVAMAASRKSRLAIALGAGGDAILIWEDDRSGAKDIYGQSINADGTLGLDPAGCDPLTLATSDKRWRTSGSPGASLTAASSSTMA